MMSLLKFLRYESSPQPDAGLGNRILGTVVIALTLSLCLLIPVSIAVVGDPGAGLRNGIFLAACCGFGVLVSGMLSEVQRARAGNAPITIARSFPMPATEAYVVCGAVVAALGYRAITLDRDHQVILFETGTSWLSWCGQNFTLTVYSDNPGSAKVSLEGRPRDFRWLFREPPKQSEAERVANRIFGSLYRLENNM